MSSRHQDTEQVVFGGCELYEPTSDPRLAPCWVDHEVAGHKDRLGTRQTGPPQDHTHSRQQFPHAEGLGEVVVYLRIQGGYFVGLLPGHRDDDDGE